MVKVGIEDLTDPDVIAGCYPLHPLAAAVLPELCSRYGQNERTLFSFLTGADPAAVPTLLETTDLPTTGNLPVIGLAEIYDYFVGGGVIAGTQRDPSQPLDRDIDPAARLPMDSPTRSRRSLEPSQSSTSSPPQAPCARRNNCSASCTHAQPKHSLHSNHKVSLLTATSPTNTGFGKEATSTCATS